MNENITKFITFSRQKLIPFVVKRKFEILLAAVLLYFLWPHLTAHLHGSGETNQTLSADGQSAQNQQAHGVPLYDPDSQNADPKWALPAELKSDRLQAFAAELDQVAKDAKEAFSLEDKQDGQFQFLLSQDVKDRLWPAVSGGGGFPEDKRLSLDWFALVKPRYDESGYDVAGREMKRHAERNLFEARTDSIKTRILGGQVLVGDTLFVKAAQADIGSRLNSLRQAVKQMDDLSDRLQDALAGPKETLKAFHPFGYKTLTLGMGIGQIKGNIKRSQGPRYPVAEWEFLDADLLNAGPFRLDSVSALIYDDKIYRITIRFSENGDALRRVLERKSGKLYQNISTGAHESKADGSSTTSNWETRISVVQTETQQSPSTWNQIQFTDFDTQGKIYQMWEK